MLYKLSGLKGSVEFTMKISSLYILKTYYFVSDTSYVTLDYCLKQFSSL